VPHSETANMDKEKVLGFSTNIGGRTSHTAIMARSFEIPAVVGLENITTTVKQGDYVIIDGDSGKVLINPNAEDIACYNKLKEKCENIKQKLQLFKDKESITFDGKKVELVGNIGTPVVIRTLDVGGDKELSYLNIKNSSSL